MGFMGGGGGGGGGSAAVHGKTNGSKLAGCVDSKF